MPAQTRGFLFSDLRGYSAFTERHGDKAARALLSTYRKVVREAIGRFDGAEVRTEGDSFYVVFASVSDAVEAGLAILTGLESAADEGRSIPAGVGIHAGEVEDSDEGIVSSAVNIAARICAIAAPGELLVSDTVRSLTRTYLDVGFVSRGRPRLKGITDRMPLYRVTPEAREEGRAGWWRGGIRGIPRSVALIPAAVILVGVSTALGAAILRESLAGTPPESHAAPSETLGPSSAAPSASEPGPADPEVAEQRLASLVDEPFQASCETADPGSVPALSGPGDSGNNWTPRRTEVHFLAGITCSPFGLDAPDELSFWQLSAAGHDSAAVPGTEEWILNRAGSLGIRRGSCAEDRRALEEWEAGPLGGYLLCSSSPTAGAILYWTYEGSDVLGRATWSEGGLDALLAWWQRDARYREP